MPTPKQPESWSEKFYRIFDKENVWKDEDGDTAYTGIGNIEKFIEETIASERTRLLEENKVAVDTSYKEGFTDGFLEGKKEQKLIKKK